MRKLLSTTLILGLMLTAAQSTRAADVNAGVSFDEDGLKGFYLSIGEHYNVPEKEVVVVRERKIPAEELPVVFYLAKRSGRDPEAIVKLRLMGNSWMDVTLQLGLNAEIYYVPLNNPGPPYGKAHGHFKKRNRDRWHEVRLLDTDIVNFVNLRFVSDHYGYSPDQIIEKRRTGESFIKINYEVKQQRNKEKNSAKHAGQDSPGKSGKAKGKGKKK